METLTWIGVGAVVLSYARQKLATVVMEQPPVPQREVDVTRWKHDGKQAPETRDGNRAPIPDPVTQQLLDELALF